MPVVQREDGAAISYEVDGPEDAPTVVLVMGLAWPAAMWFRQVPALAKTYRVLRMDNRGAGRTGDVPGAPYTVDVMAADCLAIMDDAGIRSAQVVGISMGGLIAQEMALTAPERVTSLCLVATHPGIADAVVNPDAMAVLMKRGEMTPEQAAEVSIPYNYAPGTSRDVIEEDWSIRMPLAASNEGYMAQAMGSSQWNGYDRIASLAMPTMVLHGELDSLVPPANGENIAARIPGAELVMIPDANHVLTTDQPEQVNKVLLDWLDRHR